MKYLGIDYGKKRVGIAVSDVEGKIAFPKIVLENKGLLEKIFEMCKELSVEAIVLGESKNYKGEDNKINPQIISFKKDLSVKLKLPVFLESEFMSSMQVEKTFGKTDMLDASAASIILQTFLDKEKARQEKKKQAEKSQNKKITYDDFKKVEMKIGKILSAEPVEGSDKLLKLSVDFAEGAPRQIVSGIAPFFSDIQNLAGKKAVFATNLEPKTLMGLLSNGMILAAKTDDKLAILEVPDFIKEGTELS